MEANDYGLFFKTILWLARLLTPKYEISNVKDLKMYEDPVVYISHHHNLLGAIRILPWLDRFVRVWAYGNFYDQKTCYQHYIDYTFTKRFGWPLFFAKPVAYLASYIVSAGMKSARVIPVYRQSRQIVKTLKATVETLRQGQAILIFPDIDYKSDQAQVGEIYEGFLNLEKYYYRNTGRHLNFIPLYANEDYQMIFQGRPVKFSSDLSFIEQRSIKASEIADALNHLADLTPRDQRVVNG
ncbi:hypothetical protein ACWOBE_00025 [Hutsoniella sourekii]